ncbi:MAG: porphobilinogen synthase [Deltaproteobacteria bacterium]|nr:porphobilinogen synthase [Deltaproteobacteria bacterium]
MFPTQRPRRLRQSPVIREMVRETRIHPSSLVMPLFIVPGKGVKRAISSMPGQFNLSVDLAAERAQELYETGVRSTLLFGVPDKKDDEGSSSWQDNGLVQEATLAIKKSVPDSCVIADVCFCEYTSHGHCGVMREGKLDNDATLERLVKQTLSLARAGVDMVAPSGMIDGAVGAMRQGLDDADFIDTIIMAYAAKMASGFYGPFREAAQATPQYGDRKTYQMDPANFEEALREVAHDIDEGADIVMVKPALAYLDVIRAAKDRFGLPTAAYNVSGEYAMVKAAAQAGWLDEKRVMLECLTAIRRAGADIIITYFAEDLAKAIRNGDC